MWKFTHSKNTLTMYTFVFVHEYKLNHNVDGYVNCRIRLNATTLSKLKLCFTCGFQNKNSLQLLNSIQCDNLHKNIVL